MADVGQMEKIVPLITCEIVLCQYVCELVFGVDTFDLNLWIEIDSVKQPVKSNSVFSGYVSHCWTSAFDDLFNHCFAIIKNVEHPIEMRRLLPSMKHHRHCSIEDCRAELESWFGYGCACLMRCHATRCPVLFLWISLIGLGKNGPLQ